MLVFLMVIEEERERREIPDQEDFDKDLEGGLEDWDEERNDFKEY